MRIIILGPYFGQDKKISKHNAEVGIFNALKSNRPKDEIYLYDYRNDCVLLPNGVVLKNVSFQDDIFKQYIDSNFDLIISVGPGIKPEILDSDWWRNIKNIKVKWNSDPIRLPNYKDKINSQKEYFDVHFTFDESEIPLYSNLGIENIHFLPQAYNPDWYTPIKINIGQKFPESFVFVGSIGPKWAHRMHLFNLIQQMGYKLNVATLFDAVKINKAYNMHDAVVNLGLYVPEESGAINELKAFGLQQRIFESYGSGKICITNEIPSDTNKLFEHGKDILYFNKNNLKEVLDMALDKDIRKNMEKNIEQNRHKHTYQQRMIKMFNVLEV